MTNVSTPQSTNHIFLIEPVDFYANPETMDTNAYQHEQAQDKAEIQAKALVEFRAFRDLLVEHGVMVTMVKGQKGCPDDLFPNWLSTHADEGRGGRMIIYPMMNKNRQTERRKDIINIFRRTYKDVQDFSLHEQHGKSLEATAGMCLDRVNRIAYQIRSMRADDELAAMWCKMNDYKHIQIETDYNGKPVYHADVVMWIGSEVTGVCSECLTNDEVLKHVAQYREVIEFTNEQKVAFCGNSLEVIGEGGEKMLVMSIAGYKTLHEDQKRQLDKYYKKILTPDLSTIEYYGVGSARCMMLEMF